MQMTDSERLLAVMLADLMSGLGIQGEVDAGLIKRHVINGDLWAIKMSYPGIFPTEGPSDEIVEETIDIISMMSYIEYSVSTLTDEQQAEFAGIAKARFRGFDGNNDPHYGVAETLIKDLGRFSEFKDRALNSHSQATLASYRAMKPVYDHVFYDSTGNGFSYDDLKTIVG